jgi:hypothetical protein
VSLVEAPCDGEVGPDAIDDEAWRDCAFFSVNFFSRAAKSVSPSSSRRPDEQVVSIKRC